MCSACPPLASTTTSSTLAGIRCLPPGSSTGCGALADLVARHESLRTTYPQRAAGPVQHVWQPAAPALSIVDTTEAEVDSAITQAVADGFDLTTDQPLRATLFVLGPAEHVLLLL